MTLKFLLDEDLSHRVARGLRHRGVDAVSVHEIGRAGKRISDEEQLALAVGESRVLVTYNRIDFQSIDARWRLEGRIHTGILWCTERSISRASIGELIHALMAASATYESLSGLCLPMARASS